MRVTHVSVKGWEVAVSATCSLRALPQQSRNPHLDLLACFERQSKKRARQPTPPERLHSGTWSAHVNKPISRSELNSVSQGMDDACF